MSKTTAEWVSPLMPRKIKDVEYNNLPKHAFVDVPTPPKEVLVGLGPQWSRLVPITVVEAPNDEAKVVKRESWENRHGKVMCGLSGTWFDNDPESETFGHTFPIKAFESKGNKAMAQSLNFEPNQNYRTLRPQTNADDLQTYYFLHVCGFAKTSISDPDLADYKFEIIDEGRVIEQKASTNRRVLQLQLLIEESWEKDRDMTTNIAKDLGYNGAGKGSDPYNWLISFSKDTSKDSAIRDAFNNTDVAGLKANIRRALNDQIIVYRPSDSKMAFRGESGKALVKSHKDDDFEIRVHNIAQFMLSKGDQSLQALKFLNDKLAEADGSLV
jgi:hypothetical protein